jgi:hypothetical protein
MILSTGRDSGNVSTEQRLPRHRDMLVDHCETNSVLSSGHCSPVRLHFRGRGVGSFTRTHVPTAGGRMGSR